MLFCEKRDKDTSDLNKYTWKELWERGYEVEAKKEITYFNCIDVISKSIAKCPLCVKKESKKGEKFDKKHLLWDLLKLRPNPNMNAIDTIKSYITIAISKGIGALYIKRDINRKPIELYPVIVNHITIDDAGLIKSNKNNKVLYDYYSPADNLQYSCLENDLILLKHNTEDGINTHSINSVLRENLDTSIKSQNYLNKLFSNGLTNKIAVQLTSDIKDKAEIKKIQKKFNDMYSSNGRIFTIPAGFNVNALDLKLSDAQFEQLRRLSKEEIAGAMGVPLSKLGFSKENAKSEEQDNLKFYTDTLLVYMEQIEQEMDYKLLTESERKRGYKIRFNINVLLRTDALTQANVINSYVKNGVYSLNKAKEILGIEKLDKDVTTFPSGQVTLEALLNNRVNYQNNNTKGGENIGQEETGEGNKET